MSKPTLPDGFVVVVKRDCETCQTVVPVLQQLAAATDLTVYTQDDPDFPGDPAAIHDADLGVSWHHEIETVPTLIKVVDGDEVDRTFGWLRTAWEEFTGISGLGDGLPPMRPGCGSKSVDPDLVDELNVRHGGSVLRSRRIEVADAEDEIEMMFTRGWTDGLPVVPPTEQRVLKMLAGTTRAPDEIVATVPPDLVDISVEKVAISAVMAGCLPEYLPWVLTAVEAACNDEFNMHGLLATTMPVAPVLVCSGPGTRAIGMNSGINALGQGNRANSTIGRALQLIVRNVGGGRPGEVDRAAHGNPGKLSFCFAENDAESPYGTLAGQHGVEPGVDAITVFAGEGPRGIVDQLSRTPESLANTLAAPTAGDPPPQAGARLRRDPGDGSRARPRVRRGRLGPRPHPVRAAHAAHHTGRRARARRRRHRRGHPGRHELRRPAEVPARRSDARLRRWRRRAVLVDHPRLGQRRDGFEAGHPRSAILINDLGALT